MRYNWSMAIRYWLGVVHLDSVRHGVEYGFAQLNHGARPALASMGEADGMVYYSPREYFPDGPALREFTAIGRVSDGEVYQAQDAGGDRWRPWRRRVDFDRSAVRAPIRPLVPILDFTRDNPNWGYQLRRGLLEISRHDFETIRVQMRSLPPEPSRRVMSQAPGHPSQLRSTGDHD